MIEQVLIALPLIFGAYITLSLLKLPDFSLESAYLAGAVMAFAAKGLPLPFILMSALCGGIAVGAVVCFLNQFLRIPYLLAAIVTNGLMHGCALLTLRGSVKGLQLRIPETPLLAAAAGVAIVVLLLLLRSQMGHCFAIYGNNPHFFDHHRIQKRFVLFFGVGCGHALAALSGFLFSLTSGVVDIGMNFGIIMLCLTSLMIGKLVIRGHKPNLAVPLIGIVAFFLMQQTLLRLGLDLKYFNAFQAIFVLLILSLGNQKQTQLGL